MNTKRNSLTRPSTFIYCVPQFHDHAIRNFDVSLIILSVELDTFDSSNLLPWKNGFIIHKHLAPSGCQQPIVQMVIWLC